MREISHIINPVFLSAEQDFSSLAKAQPITFASLKCARQYAALSAKVGILAVGFPEDAVVVPSDFVVTKALGRSVLDIADFEVSRKLPILRDILEIGLASSDAEYFVYTNIDLGVTANFYQTINEIIDEGYDAFTITRRTIPIVTTDPDDLTLVQSLVGEPHPGHDCFVFHRDILENIVLDDTCVGAQYLVPPFLANLLCHAKKFGRFDQFHLTFHLGDDRVWKTDRFRDYAHFNFAQAAETLYKLDASSLLVQSPLIKRWVERFTPNITYSDGPSVHVPLWAGRDA